MPTQTLKSSIHDFREENMHILLINPMASRKPPIKERRAHFPIGIGLIAAYLQENGFFVTVLDNETECLNKYQLADFIKASTCDVFGISAMAPQYNYVKGLAKLIKSHRTAPIILGGPLASYSHNTVLKHTDVDVCVIGEGEETIVDLLHNLDNLQNVSGIAFKQDKSTFLTPPRKLNKSRDQYPFPAFELFNMEPYFKKQLGQYEGWGATLLNKNLEGLRSIAITTGIGCPYRCRFCSRSVIRPRLRSVDNIIGEIKHCIGKFGINGVRFIDDLLIINEKRSLELCEKIKPLNLSWSGQARTNTFSPTIAKAMKEAGCVGVGFGYESGSDRLLRAMNKEVTVDDHTTATLTAKRNGLAIRVQLLFGYPGENKESIDATIEFFKEINIPPRRFNILTPLPGSKLYDECLQNRIITNEDEYLGRVSQHDAGFGTKKVLLNLTEMTDDEFESLLSYAENTLEYNYKASLPLKSRLKYFLLYDGILHRQFGRIRKITSISAWKRKYVNTFQKPHQLKLTRNQIEDLYFRL